LTATETLDNLFGQLKIKAKVKSCKRENSFLIFDVVLNPGGTFKKIERYSTEIALGLKSISNPLVYPVPKQGIIRIEMMVQELEDISFSEVIRSKEFLESNYKLPIALGKTKEGNPLVVDLTEFPHLLVGGATGSGKSVLLHTIINNLLSSANNFKLALIDTKRIEFSYYENISKLYCPVAKDIDSSLLVLNNLIDEMENRFYILERAGCRNISEYNGKMGYIVVVIDELADLMLSSEKKAQELICRLAQKSRACGIHIVMATQRPSVDIVTGALKANFPVRIACQVSSAVDSRVILDKSGAETLFGKGDAILDGLQYKFIRFKGSYINENDILVNVKRNLSKWNKILNF
jgi:S-DNA-T family DNA segregation ATPase FtsK/SpoIIIE